MLEIRQKVGAAQFPGQAQGASAHRRRIAQQPGKLIAGIDPVNRAGRDAQIPALRAHVAKQRAHATTRLLLPDPAERGNEGAKQCRLRLGQVEHIADPVFRLAFERQHRRNEGLARILIMVESRLRRFPTPFAGHAETVDMCLQPLIEPVQLLQPAIMRVCRRIALQPEKRGVLRVLVDDVLENLAGHYLT